MISAALTPKEAARQLAHRAIADGFAPEALHEYTDAEGLPVWWRIRLKNAATGEKWIRPMKRTDAGYALGEPEFQAGKPLYKLHDLTSRLHEVVFVCEGERCADVLAKVGILATTSGAADSALKADWRPLAGRVVTIWPDNDEPGRCYGEAVAGILSQLGCKAQTLDIGSMGLPHKGDAVDWLAANPGADAAGILALPIRMPNLAPERPANDEPAGDWPEPTPLPNSLPPVQAFDAELLPVALRAWVMDIANRMQCPPDFPAVGAIVALSSLIGARAVVRPKEKDDWQVTANLWGMIVGRPGVMKSPALAEALKPLRRLEGEELERWQAAHDDWALGAKVAELQIAANEKQARDCVAKDPDKARALLQRQDLPPEPQLRRLILNDATVEKLGEILRVNLWGTLAYRDELHGLLTGMDKQGQEGSRAFYLQSYDGNQGYTFDRIGRGTVHIPRVCLSLLGAIQPGKIQEYVRGAVTGGGADDGLLQRFGLVVWPDMRGEFRNVDRWPDSEAKCAANAVFERLTTLEPASDLEPEIWRFDADAQRLFVEWRVPYEQELIGGELHPAMESHLAKYRKLVPALALIFALVDTPDSGGLIGEKELLRALAWADYLKTHANRLYSAAMMPEVSGAASLLRKLQSRALEAEFTPSKVAQKGWSGLTTPEAVRRAAQVLIEFDWLRAATVQTGGRPSERYYLNPRACNEVCA